MRIECVVMEGEVSCRVAIRCIAWLSRRRKRLRIICLWNIKNELICRMIRTIQSLEVGGGGQLRCLRP